MKSRPAAGAARAAKASEQRAAKASEQPPAKASEQRATKASRPSEGGTSRPAASKAPAAAPAPRTPSSHSAPPERERAGDPIVGAVRAGVNVVEGGVKLAGGLTRDLLRRLPRP